MLFGDWMLELRLGGRHSHGLRWLSGMSRLLSVSTHVKFELQADGDTLFAKRMAVASGRREGYYQGCKG